MERTERTDGSVHDGRRWRPFWLKPPGVNHQQQQQQRARARRVSERCRGREEDESRKKKGVEERERERCKAVVANVITV
jgi:hypothetical protein